MRPFLWAMFAQWEWPAMVESPVVRSSRCRVEALDARCGDADWRWSEHPASCTTRPRAHCPLATAACAWRAACRAPAFLPRGAAGRFHFLVRAAWRPSSAGATWRPARARRASWSAPSFGPALRRLLGGGAAWRRGLRGRRRRCGRPSAAASSALVGRFGSRSFAAGSISSSSLLIVGP